MPPATRSRESRRAARHADTRAEILAAAWELVHTQGLAGLSMRDLGGQVGMRAQSIYSYFESKDEIYDAMFRQGYEEFIAAMPTPSRNEELSGNPLAYLRSTAHSFFEFCTADSARYQLLFQRTIPGFAPSTESYSVAVGALTDLHGAFRDAGITDPEAPDIATAVFTGLASQQLANDPGGDRWQRLIDRCVSMTLAEVAPQLLANASGPPAPNEATSAPNGKARQ